MLVHGPSGAGKTHVAAAIANRCIERGQPALFVVVPDLLDHLRASYSPNSELGYDALIEQVRNAPVLILDDLGTQSSTAWAQEKLFQVLNHRYNAQLPTDRHHQPGDRPHRRAAAHAADRPGDRARLLRRGGRARCRR